MLAAFGKRLFNALLFAEVPLADELDLHARVRCQFLGVFANAVPERLREPGIVENPNVSLEQKGGHPSGKTDLRQGSENQHSVPATQYARNLVPVPFRQQLDGHSGIIASPVWFRLCRVRYSPTMSRTFSTKNGSAESLKESVRCGCNANARQIRDTAVWDKPLSFAIVRVLQCVACPGRFSSVRLITSSTC